MTQPYIILILGYIFGFYMAWNIGANDVANSMASSVGAKAITIRQAIFLAGILNILGAVFIGVLYKYTPEPEVSWGSVWFPAIATMVMLWIGAGIYGVYLTNYGFQSVTGVAGTVVLGLVLVYYASMILLYGMEMVKLLHEDTVPESISLRSSG